MTAKQMCTEAMKAVLKAADPFSATRNCVTVKASSFYVRNQLIIPNLQDFTEIYVFGAGKASCEMASALVQTPGLPPITGGLIVTKTGHGTPQDKLVCGNVNIQVVEASHPIPDENSRVAVENIFARLDKISSQRTLIFWLASGGGSALLGGFGLYSLSRMQEIYQTLLGSGLPIEEMNTVRKRISMAHGGRIAAAIGKESTLVTLCVSDIVNSPLHSIAGGPTCLDETTMEECRKILKRIHLELDVLQDTPKALPRNVRIPLVLVDNQYALLSAMNDCQKLFPQMASVHLLTHRLEGEAQDMGRFLAHVAMDTTLPLPLMLFAGGETTVRLPHDCGSVGIGGRNQELALAAGIELARSHSQTREITLLAFGTDGTDGPTSAAGAMVSNRTFVGIEKEAESALERHDSFTFFHHYCPEAHVISGPTGTNVMDIIILIVK